jgi:hypothetical protein
MARSYWLAVAAYLLPTFPLGYLWHLKAFKPTYDRLEVYRPTMIIPFGVVAMLVQALIYAWLYPHLFSTARTDWAVSSVCFGGLFGALAWTLVVLPAAAKYRMTSVSQFLRIETAFTLLHYAIVAPLIALAWRSPT